MTVVRRSPSPGEGSESSPDQKDSIGQDLGGASVRPGKASPKEFCQSFLNSVNKSTSQIKKTSRRRSASPLNWFPRKKTDSFLNRKIKHIQEVGGMKSSLDETLGDSNPHYCRVEREKIAAREAARKAMEARKAAMIEASWCQMLRAARIPSQEAEYELEKAEKNVEEAFQTAAETGVIMYDKSDCPRRPSDVETSTRTGGQSTHTFTASFETAFEVYKEVAAAVKVAFIHLATDHSSNKDEFQDLLRTISQNPDLSDIHREIAEIKSESESDAGECLKPQSNGNTNLETSEKKLTEKQNWVNPWRKPKILVNVMLDRLKHLHEDELASLATVVATSGLNDALHEVQQLDIERADQASFMNGHSRKEEPTGLPSLDKFLVRHVSRLEREIQEAKNARKNNQHEGKEKDTTEPYESALINSSAAATLPDLGSFLVKHKSRLEKEIEEARKQQKASDMGREEKVDQQSRPLRDGEQCGRINNLAGSPGRKQPEKENVDSNKINEQLVENSDGLMSRTILADQGPCHVTTKTLSRLERAKLEALQAFSGADGLDKVLIKHVSRLELDKMAASIANGKLMENTKKDKPLDTQVETLDKVLVKHVSKLEKEKMAFNAEFDREQQKKKKTETVATDFESLDKVLVKHVSRLERDKTAFREIGRVAGEPRTKQGADESLGEILIKHQSRLEKEKRAASAQSTDSIKHSETRKEAREREMLEAWGGMSLGNSMKPHVSRLEKDKAAWRRAEEEERRRAAGLPTS